jgi:hypothetical protein
MSHLAVNIPCPIMYSKPANQSPNRTANSKSIDEKVEIKNSSYDTLFAEMNTTETTKKTRIPIRYLLFHRRRQFHCLLSLSSASFFFLVHSATSTFGRILDDRAREKKQKYHQEG